MGSYPGKKWQSVIITMFVNKFVLLHLAILSPTLGRHSP